MSFLWQAVDQHPVVSDRDFNRFLRYPANRPLEGPLAENALWARDWFRAHARPWCCAIRASESVRAKIGISLLPEGELAVVAVSAGAEPEAEAAVRWADDEPDRYFFLECLAAAVVEAVLADTRRRLGADRHYCPGFRGWPINDNQHLLDALLAAGTLPGPLAVLPSGMLVPKKSQLAVCALRSVPAPAR